MGGISEAIEVFARAMEINPTYDLYSNLATLYFYQGQYADAARMYEKALELQGIDHQVWGYLASAYYWAPGERAKTQGAYQRAATLAEERWQINPHDPDLLSSLARYYGMLGERERALSMLETLIAMKPERLEVLFRIAEIYEYLGDRDRALPWFEKVLEKGYSLAEIETNPWLDDVRTDERFQRMLEKHRGAGQ